MLTGCWPHTEAQTLRLTDTVSLTHVHSSSFTPSAVLLVCLGLLIISIVGGVLSGNQKCWCVCVCVRKATWSQNPQFDQTRVEAIRSASSVSALIMFWTFVNSRADSYHQFTRERGQLKAMCQPYLEPLSLSTKQHFTATLETVRCNTRLMAFRVGVSSLSAGVWCQLLWGIDYRLSGL